MDRERKKKTAAALAALLYLEGEEAARSLPSRWSASGRESIMHNRARITARQPR